MPAGYQKMLVLFSIGWIIKIMNKFENHYDPSRLARTIKKLEVKKSELEDASRGEGLRHAIGNIILGRSRRIENADGRLSWLYKNLHFKLPGVEFETVDQLDLDSGSKVSLKADYLPAPTAETVAPELDLAPAETANMTQSAQDLHEEKIPA